LYGTEKEADLFKPADAYWHTAGLDASKRQVSFDVIVFPSVFCELVTIGHLSHLTGGRQSLFVNFSPESDSHRLRNVLTHSCLEAAGYGAIVRLRCSQGLRVKGYHGHFVCNEVTDMDCAGISSSSSFVADLAHESKIDPKSYCYLQCAVLFTTRAGQRRVRVHTLKLPVANAYSSLFRHADLEATTLTLVYQSVQHAMNKGTKAAREWLNNRVIDILLAYRKHCSSSSHTGQLLLPEQLKLMPLYVLCLMKSDALAPGTVVSLDSRVQSMFDLMAMPMSRALSYLYPRLYALQTILSHQFAGQLKNPDGGDGGAVFMPPLQQLTTDTIMTHGVYLLQDQQANIVYLWLGSAVSPRVASQVFGVESVADVEGGKYETWHPRLVAVIEQLITLDGTNGRLVVIHERGHSLEDAFFRAMLEDEAVPGAQSYSEFLCALHRTINQRLS